MYEIEVCYKIIFEAMLEKPVLKSIAEKINEYTGAKVIFVSGTGKILAYSHTCEQDGSESIRWKHVTFSDYKKFCQEADTKEHQLVLQPVETMGRLAGYVVILYSEEESRRFFEELGSVIGQAVRHQFEDVVKETMVLTDARSHTCLESVSWESRWDPADRKNMDRTMHRSINVKKGYSGKECIVDKRNMG